MPVRLRQRGMTSAARRIVTCRGEEVTIYHYPCGCTVGNETTSEHRSQCSELRAPDACPRCGGAEVRNFSMDPWRPVHLCDACFDALRTERLI